VDLVVVLEAGPGAEVLLTPEDLVLPVKVIQAEALMATMVAAVAVLALLEPLPHHHILLDKAAQELRLILQELG
jgi:hypothetical protein